MDVLQEIAQTLQKGEAVKVAELVQKGLNEKLSWDVMLNKGLFAGMEAVGKLFKEDEMFVPEVIMAAKAMDAGIKVLEPAMAKAGGRQKVGTVILGTVKGDIHDLGKNLVAIMLKGAGFEVIDIGVDAPAEKYVSAVTKEGAQIVAMSALLTTTMPYMRTVIEALKDAGLERKVKTLIGGACVTQQYANEIGADAFGENAGAAVDKARKLLNLS